jgi:hypothetical protein
MNDSVHNPDQYMASLRQILSQGRKRLGFLIGAGAPLAIKVNATGALDPAGRPLIPAVNELTNMTMAALKGEYSTAATSIRGELGATSNIEAILSRVRLLERAIGSTKVNGLDGEGYMELGKAICKQIGSIVNIKLPKSRCAYTELISWVGGTMRPNAVEIFTTNYDLLLEETFERARAPYFDGFAGGVAPFFDPVTVAGDDLPARWSRLWKLHGSLGWAMEDGSIVRRGDRNATQLVYPDHLKYDLTQKQPYAALFERLKEFLLTPDTLLLATGCSFRDAHVCTVLDEALAMNTGAAVFAFQYGKLSDENSACTLAYNHPNMTVYAADGAIVSGVAGRWVLRDPPKNWTEIRSSFWGKHQLLAQPGFLLGDFVFFARFCALAQATDVVSQQTDALAEALSQKLTDGISR